MTELSLHILDIAQNSVVAGANLVSIEVIEDTKDNKLIFSVEDNGKGMSEEFLKNVTDPFTTTRTTRKVGMGISLLKAAAESTDGYLTITSKLGVGTKTTACFTYDHIDRQPMGDIISTMVTLITMNTHMDFVYRHEFVNEDRQEEFLLDTRELKRVLDGVSLAEPEIVTWIKEFMVDGIPRV